MPARRFSTATTSAQASLFGDATMSNEFHRLFFALMPDEERLYASGLSLLWGEELAHTVRDLLIEVAKNAISHGHAKKICLDIEPHSVSIVDNGTPFNTSSLNNKGAKSGGSVTFQNFAQNYESRATLQYEFVNRTNQVKDFCD